MEVEPRIAKPYKCHHCCSCKNYRRKGMEGGKNCLCVIFLADQKIASSWEKKIGGGGGGAYTSNKLLLVARHMLTTGLQKSL